MFSQLDRFTAIAIKIQASYFVDIVKLILMFMWRDKRTTADNSIYTEKRKNDQNDMSHMQIYALTT